MSISVRIVHLIIQAGVVNIEGQQCFQLQLLALWFLALRSIYPSGMVTSMEGNIPLAILQKQDLLQKQ